MTEPMGNSGVQVDFITGQPHSRGEDQERQRRLRRHSAQAFEAGQRLKAELAQNQGAVLRVLEEALVNRALQVLEQDDHYQALMGLAQTLGFRINIVPKLVGKKLSEFLGEDLYRLTRTPTASEETPVEEL
uniref:Uncharacterized protein n=1 Tax=Desulfobacca acetoxidans TaxID=60893 RepID=A0A7C3UXA6_9BACT